MIIAWMIEFWKDKKTEPENSASQSVNGATGEEKRDGVCATISMIK